MGGQSSRGRLGALKERATCTNIAARITNQGGNRKDTRESELQRPGTPTKTDRVKEVTHEKLGCARLLL